MEVPAPRTDTERQTEPVSTGRWRAFEAAIQRMGKDEYDLMLRLLSFLDEGRKDALRAQFADMMGFGRMSTLEQERKLAGSKAYQKALADATGSAEKDKRMLRDVFERFARVRAIEERMKLRQERLKRMRHAVETRLNQRIAEYEAKKRLYDQKFEDIENAAYAAAQDRLTDDRRRYEALAQELEKRLHEETLSIAQAQEAMEEAAAEPPPKPRPAPPRPAAAPAKPAPSEQAPAEGYIDLGAMILGGGDPKSTRFKVAYEEPTGDEDADFAKMLSQFKEKVSENIDSGDVRAHYDLGTAYKEMGLLQEAIGAFQSALRASAEHLPTYEIMGQTFMEMGEPEAAVKTLQRALQVKAGVEDEFVGIYYYLARAYESIDQKASALEFYDRVFSLDINFADVTERLRGLR